MSSPQSRDSILLAASPVCSDGRAGCGAAVRVAKRRPRPIECARARRSVSVRMRKHGGVGKPAHVYSLTAQGEIHFSRAYIPFLLQLLDELSDRHPPSELDALLSAVGERMASGRFVGLRTERAHAEAAAAALAEFGGDVEVEADSEDRS